jgi:hypothetical protein
VLQASGLSASGLPGFCFILRSGAVPSPAGERLGVPLNHGELADMTGSSQPDVQRAFAYLRSRGPFARHTAHRSSPTGGCCRSRT